MTSEQDGPQDPAFAMSFQKLADRCPFPWQTGLHRRLRAGDIPSAYMVPTGLGKTSALATWFLARLDKLLAFVLCGAIDAMHCGRAHGGDVS